MPNLYKHDCDGFQAYLISTNKWKGQVLLFNLLVCISFMLYFIHSNRSLMYGHLLDGSGQLEKRRVLRRWAEWLDPIVYLIVLIDSWWKLSFEYQSVPLFITSCSLSSNPKSTPPMVQTGDSFDFRVQGMSPLFMKSGRDPLESRARMNERKMIKMFPCRLLVNWNDLKFKISLVTKKRERFDKCDWIKILYQTIPSFFFVDWLPFEK